MSSNDVAITKMENEPLINNSVERRRVALIVLHDVVHDARVLKTAHAAHQAGYDVLVIGLSKSNQCIESEIDGISIVCLANPNVFASLDAGQGASKPSLTTKIKVWTSLIARTKKYFKDIVRRYGGFESHDKMTQAVNSFDVRLNRYRDRLERLQEGSGILSRLRRSFGFFVKTVRQLDIFIFRCREDIHWGRRPNWRKHLGAKVGRFLGIKLNSNRVKSSRVKLSLIELIDYLVEPVTKELKRFEPDVIHANDVTTIKIGYETVCNLAKVGINRPCFLYDAHEYVSGFVHLSDEIHQGLLAQEKQYIGKADIIITVSPTLADNLARDYSLSKKPEVVLNAPRMMAKDPDYPTIRSKLGLSKNSPLLVYSGNISALRGTDTLIEAMPYLPECHLALVVSAKGTYYKYIMELAEEIGVLDRVHQVDYVPYDKVTSFLSDATIGVHPIQHYGNADVALPNKMFEYLHAGLPQIVSNVQSMSEFMAETHIGITFNVGDPIDLARAVKEMLTDYKTYHDRVHGQPELLKNYCWEKQSQHLIECYSACIMP